MGEDEGLEVGFCFEMGCKRLSLSYQLIHSNAQVYHTNCSAHGSRRGGWVGRGSLFR